MWRSLLSRQAGGGMCTYVNGAKTMCLAGGDQRLLSIGDSLPSA